MYYQLSRGYWAGKVSSDKVGKCDKQMWADLRSGKGASYSLNATYGYSSGKSLGELSLETISGYGSKALIKSGGKQNFTNMSAAHKKAGKGSLSITSSFRAMTTQATQAKGIDNSGQIELYALYKVGAGNLASTPGYSNHQHGGALDLGNFSHSWLKANAKSYKFSGISSEDWHWNYNV
jgi:LAS superfamily LD-carboxypeptidase LdcB